MQKEYISTPATVSVVPLNCAEASSSRAYGWCMLMHEHVQTMLALAMTVISQETTCDRNKPALGMLTVFTSVILYNNTLAAYMLLFSMPLGNNSIFMTLHSY